MSLNEVYFFTSGFPKTCDMLLFFEHFQKRVIVCSASQDYMTKDIFPPKNTFLTSHRTQTRIKIGTNKNAIVGV